MTAERETDVEAIAAEHGHWAASAFPHDQGGEGLVCECGLPWTPGEGCSFVQGAAALAPLLAARDHAAKAEGGPWSAQDGRDVSAFLIREADQRVKFFPQRRDGVDALMRHLAARAAPYADQPGFQTDAAHNHPDGTDCQPSRHEGRRLIKGCPYADQPAEGGGDRG